MRRLRTGALLLLAVLLVSISAWGFAAGLGEYSDRPITRAGTISLAIEGQSIGRVTAEGAAQCILEDQVNVAVHAGVGMAPELRAADGRLVRVQLGLVGGTEPHLTLAIADTAASDTRSPGATLALDGGASRNGGTLTLAGLAPRDPATGQPAAGEGWSGTISWQCSF
jgi:hypothetical protein